MLRSRLSARMAKGWQRACEADAALMAKKLKGAEVMATAFMPEVVPAVVGGRLVHEYSDMRWLSPEAKGYHKAARDAWLPSSTRIPFR